MTSILGADAAPYTVPDAIEPVRAWRIYRVNADGNLASVVHHGEILPGEAFHASCDHAYGGRTHEAPAADCSCGIYAARDLAALLRMGYDPTTPAYDRGPRVLAEVSLWGRVVPAEHGYRAQFAYPHRLYCESPDMRAELSMRYGVECLPMIDELSDARWAASLRLAVYSMRERKRAAARAARMQAAIDAYREGRPGARVPHPAHYSEARGNYGALLAWIGAGRVGYRRPYRNNTELLILDDGRIGMRLHSTIVATWDGGEGIESVTFDTGGWDTMTTRERMNDACSLFGVGGRVGSDGYYMPKTRTRWGTESSRTLRWWPPNYWRDMPAVEDGRTREGRVQLAARRDWIRANCPEI